MSVDRFIGSAGYGGAPTNGGKPAAHSETTVSESTLAMLISRHPNLAAEFERLGLDYCCHADRPLAKACAVAGVPLAVALDAVARIGSDHDDGTTINWPQLGLVDLVDHIENLHHRFLHLELPSLVLLSGKVLKVHGVRHPELARLEDLVCDLREEFVPHLAKEERVVFPAIRELADGYTGFPFGSVVNPIAVMMDEHESVGAMLQEARELTSGYSVPDDACQSYRSFYERLSVLESDTHVHVMKENSFLFPRVVELEAALDRR